MSDRADAAASGGYPVGAVAALTGVSVRTLHHYDEIGLVTPGERSPAGYRQYRTEDLDRLRRVLFYRELGLRLDRIAALLADDEPSTHLGRQRVLLLERIAPAHQPVVLRLLLRDARGSGRHVPGRRALHGVLRRGRPRVGGIRHGCGPRQRRPGHGLTGHRPVPFGHAD